MARNVVGSPARGQDFFDREELIERVWERLDTDNLLLAAPRRFGKTSVMLHLLDHPRGNWHPVHLDAESIRSPSHFIVELLDALLADSRLRNSLRRAWRRLGKWTKAILDDTEVTAPGDVSVKLRLKEAVGDDWSERGAALLAALKDVNRRLLLIIDEFSIMLQLFAENDVDDATTRAFLYWFRKVRTDPQVGLTDCRFVIGGSIGIEDYLSRLGAVDSFNDFEKIALREFSPQRAAEFVDTLLGAHSLLLSDAARAQILKLVGVPVPYFIQVFVAELAADYADNSVKLGPKRIEDIYHRCVLGAVCKSYFQHYYDRLRFYEPGLERAAKVILQHLAQADLAPIQKSALRNLYGRTVGEEASDEGFAQLFAGLENDFYVRYLPEHKGYAFASKILSDWWRRYYAF